MSIFIPDTKQLTKAIEKEKDKQKQADGGPAPSGELKLMSERFAALLKQFPTGDPTMVDPPGCTCHVFKKDDVLSSWSYFIPQISGGRKVQSLRKVCDDYQTGLEQAVDGASLSCLFDNDRQILFL